MAISLLNDKRRARKEAEGPADDEASELDLTPESIDSAEPVAALPEQTGKDRVNGYDDVT
ncbi:hypothetical protein GCM10023238_10390 [Streptomyces heliomycini]